MLRQQIGLGSSGELRLHQGLPVMVQGPTTETVSYLLFFVLWQVVKAGGPGNPSKVQDVECIIDENGGIIPFQNHSEQQTDSLGYPTGRVVSAIAATATQQGGPI